MDDSENRGTPKSSILIGFSIINHPFWGVSLVLETPIYRKIIVSIYTISQLMSWTYILGGLPRQITLRQLLHMATTSEQEGIDPERCSERGRR